MFVFVFVFLFILFTVWFFLVFVGFCFCVFVYFVYSFDPNVLVVLQTFYKINPLLVIISSSTEVIPQLRGDEDMMIKLHDDMMI